MTSLAARQPGVIKQTGGKNNQEIKRHNVYEVTTNYSTSNQNSYRHNDFRSKDNSENRSCQIGKNHMNNSNTSISINLSKSSLNRFPSTFEGVEKAIINSLILDDNQIIQCVIDLAQFSTLQTLSIQTNYMVKFNLRRPVTQRMFTSIKVLNLSYNNLQFLDLTPIQSLQALTLSHNNLSTLILPQTTSSGNSNLQYLNLSYNSLSNIQYSVFGGKVFSGLRYLNIRSNNKCLYDIVLQTNTVQIVPMLTELDCGNNVISFFEYLPHTIQILNLENNQLIFDRRSLNQILQLSRLKSLNVSGNLISQNFIQIIKSKISLPNFELLYTKQQLITQKQKREKRTEQREIKNKKQQKIEYKQSPYRIYEQSQQKNNGVNRQAKSLKNMLYSNFTLGDESAVNNQNNCEDEDQAHDPDPEYNLIQMSPTLHNKLNFNTNTHTQNQMTSEKKFVGKEFVQIQVEQQQDEKMALKSIQNTLKTRKYKLKIEGTRYQNHYRLYFDKLKQFMIMPPHPILHKNRSSNISVRIQTPSDNLSGNQKKSSKLEVDKQKFANQFSLLNQMLKNRGGIHYLRKIFNWQRTQETKSQNTSIMFINIQLSQLQFQNLCDGNYAVIDNALANQKHALNFQPCSFSCYHILARVDMTGIKGIWTCLYLIQAVHL